MQKKGYTRILAVLACVVLVTQVALAQNEHLNWCGLQRYVDESIHKNETHASSYIKDTRFEPFVIRRSGRQAIDTFSFKLTVSDSTITSVKVELREFGTNLIFRQGSSASVLELYDDGTHGDEIAGDKVFTIDRLTTTKQFALPLERRQSWKHSPIPFEFTFRDGSQVMVEERMAAPFMMIDAAVIPLPQVHQVAPGIFATEHVVNITYPEPLGVFPAQFFGDSSNVHPRLSAVKKFFQVFPNDPDFIFLENLIGFVGEREGDHEIAGTYGSIRNDDLGFGQTIYDDRDRVDLNEARENLKGIANLFGWEPNTTVLNHEILHQWAVQLDSSLLLGQAHWLFSLERPWSGFAPAVDTLIQQSDSTFLVIQNSGDGALAVQYNDLELYLMGLMAPAEVRNPIRILVSFRFLNSATDPFGLDRTAEIYQAERIHEVTIADIVALHGLRTPSAENAQKDFSSAFIVPYDRPLTAIEFAYFDYLMKEYEKPFSGSRDPAQTSFLTFEAATGGRATMKTRIITHPESNTAPVVMNAIEDVEIILGGDSFTQDLTTVFSDPDGDALNFSASNSAEAVATAAVSDSILTVTAISGGTATITITADDGRGGSASTAFTVNIPTVVTVERLDDELPKNFALHQNYPNPFNPVTTITFDLRQPSTVALTVYDVLGREVVVLASGDYPAGSFTATWDATGLSSGAYVYQLKAGPYTKTRKLLLLK